ncbi:MAG TPA: sugar ABC transporter ATP-binding protein [Spirochaetia bacterium]
MTREAVRTESISREFPGVKALKGVDFSLNAGEIHGLVGENGAGKSTLINILSGLFPPSSGSLQVFGKRVEEFHPSRATSLGVATVHQETVLVPDFSAEENIWLGREDATAGVVRPRSLRKKTEELCARYDIHVPLSRPVQRFRVAEQKLVEVLRALSMDARIFVFDEPTEAMSQSDAENLFRILKNLKDKGFAILYVSHHLEEVFRICDRITVLRNGEKVGTYLPSELDMGKLIALITNRDVGQQYPPVPPLGELSPLFVVEHLQSRENGLDDVSFHVEAGELVAFFGMVGSRRTELMKCLFGALPVRGGRLLLDGVDARFRNPRAAMRRGVYLCPEDRKGEGLVLDMSVEENCTIPFLDRFSWLGVVSDARARSATKGVADELAIKTPSLAQKILYLSGGNQQKVVIGKWLVGPRPRLFIFDEPTKGIDVGTKREVYRLMQELARRGAGVIFVSSDLPELLGVADRLYVMRRGRIAAEVSRAQFDPHAILSAALTEETTQGGQSCIRA